MSPTGIGAAPGPVNCEKIPVAFVSQSLSRDRGRGRIAGGIVQLGAVERALAVQHAPFAVLAQATPAPPAHGGLRGIKRC